MTDLTERLIALRDWRYGLGDWRLLGEADRDTLAEAANRIAELEAELEQAQDEVKAAYEVEATAASRAAYRYRGALRKIRDGAFTYEDGDIADQLRGIARTALNPGRRLNDE